MTMQLLPSLFNEDETIIFGEQTDVSNGIFSLLIHSVVTKDVLAKAKAMASVFVDLCGEGLVLEDTSLLVHEEDCCT